MGKRRNRQPDVPDDGSEDSSESGEKRNTGGNCPHVAKAINLAKYFNILKKNGISTECGTCKRLEMIKTPLDEEGFSTMPPPLWICLRCAHQGCGRQQESHAEQHFKTPRSDCHCLAIDTQCWSIWCYLCEIEVKDDSRKRLLKIVEFSKKLASSSAPANHQPIPLPSAQMEIKIENTDKQKSKVPLDGLTRVVGLSNLGNTCFFNAVLQCLNQTPFLVKILEDLQEPGEKFTLPGGKWKSSDDAEEVELPPIEGTLEGWGPFTAVLCKTLKSMQSMKTNQTFTPQELLSTFKKKSSQCMDGGQHDSHELLRHLLELVRNEDLRRYQKIILMKECGTSKVNEDSVDNRVKGNVKFYGRQANARLLGPDLVFRGVLVSTLECIDCHHSSQRTEPFLDLSLPVMADKPQPPVVKRKNSGLDETFDSMGNSITSAHTKHQLRKEEKSAEKHKRQVKKRNKELIDVRQTNAKGLIIFGDPNSISEENPAGILQLESDADVEDNISAPEVVESGYSSEKVSAVASPVSPTDPELPNNPMNPTDLNDTLINGNLPLSPNDASESSDVANKKENPYMELPGLTPMNVTINFNEMELHNSEFTWRDSAPLESELFSSISFNGEGVNEMGELSGVSPSTSLIVNSELSPEAATVSPLSSPVTSKDSPTSPPSSATDGENIQAEMNEIRLLIENPSRKVELSDMETLEYQTPQFPEDQSTPSTAELPEIKVENGVADITVGLSKVAVTSSHSQPTRYHTKDGDCSIQSCLNQFTALELMSGSNKVGCEACTTRENKGKEGATKMVCTPSTKQYLISRVPAILILHLKRFQSQRMGFRKVAKHVTFPVLLDLAPVCKGGGKPKLYSLYGVVVHSGCLHGGHYVAYVKTRPPLTPEDPRWAFLPKKDSKESAENSSASSSDSEADEAKSPLTAESPPGRWYYVSDSRLMEVDEATVLDSQAYILFYERIL